MPFMEPQIAFGKWVQIEGSVGTEVIDAELVGEIEPYHGEAIPIPESLEPFCENGKVTEIRVIEGYGARFSRRATWIARPGLCSRPKRRRRNTSMSKLMATEKASGRRNAPPLSRCKVQMATEKSKTFLKEKHHVHKVLYGPSRRHARLS